MPTIDAKNSTRAFYVDNGGFLDLRFVRVIKGRFTEVIPFVEYHLRAPVPTLEVAGWPSLQAVDLRSLLLSAFAALD